jgi:hypothetical protein
MKNFIAKALSVFVSHIFFMAIQSMPVIPGPTQPAPIPVAPQPVKSGLPPKSGVPKVTSSVSPISLPTKHKPPVITPTKGVTPISPVPPATPSSISTSPTTSATNVSPVLSLSPSQPSALQKSGGEFKIKKDLDDCLLKKGELAKEIGRILSEAKYQKSELKSIIEEVDNKVNIAQKKSSESREKAFLILRQESKSKGEQIYKEIIALFDEIQGIQKDLEGATLKQFNEKIALLNSKSDILQKKLQEFEATEQKEKKLEDSLVALKKEIADRGQKKELLTKKKEEKKKKPSFEGFSGKIATVIAFFVNVFHNIKNWLMKRDTGIEKNKEKVINKVQPVTPPVQPNLVQKIPSLPQQFFFSPLPPYDSQGLQKLLANFDFLVREIDSVKVVFLGEHKKAKGLFIFLKEKSLAFPEVLKYYQADRVKSIKGIIMHILSKVVDVSIFVGDRIFSLARKIYTTFIFPTVSDISKKVYDKLHLNSKKE